MMALRALDRYAARTLNFVLVVTRRAVLGAPSAPKDTINQPRGFAGRSRGGAPWLLFVLPMVALSVAPAGSHHAFSPVYDASRTVTIEGVVMQFRFVNPHAMLLLDVTDKAGKVVTWNIEFAGRLNLEEAGWTAEAIKAGERVTITGNPAWKSTPRLAFVKLTRADGTTLLPGRAQRLEAIEEERRQRARQRNQSK